MYLHKLVKISRHMTWLWALSIGIGGCSEQGYSVLASTGTVIGVEISENPATQMPHAKLGYNRAELAFVPTNRNGKTNSKDSQGNGAADTANVLMELRYGGIFDTGPSSGIYQRVAVGTIAVQQDGASVMFAKNADGKLDPESEKALAATKAIPSIQGSVESKKLEMTENYLNYKSKGDLLSINKYDEAVKSVDAKNFKVYSDFANDRKASVEKIKAVCAILKSKNENITCD